MNNNAVRKHLDSLLLGPAQRFLNLIIFPLKTAALSDPPCITLDDALSSGSLTITEIDEEGDVSELLAHNRGRTDVLMLDGEELIGAKQNRALTTSVLVSSNSSTVIPVTCTEQLRWDYRSREFSSTRSIMPCSIRTHKSASVSHSLRSRGGFESSQSGVWEDISKLALKSGVKSLTQAMHDVVQAKDGYLRQQLRHAPLISGQQGLFVFKEGEVAGFDLIPQASIYARYHEKLVRSYVLEGMNDAPKRPMDLDRAAHTVTAFLNEIANAREWEFRSVGKGSDWRYETSELSGNALVASDRLVHGVFFGSHPRPGHSNINVSYQRTWTSQN